jgi:hypothetical protein
MLEDNNLATKKVEVYCGVTGIITLLIGIALGLFLADLRIISTEYFFIFLFAAFIPLGYVLLFWWDRSY